jgi:hypothetical protein
MELEAVELGVPDLASRALVRIEFGVERLKNGGGERETDGHGFTRGRRNLNEKQRWVRGRSIDGLVGGAGCRLLAVV